MARVLDKRVVNPALDVTREGAPKALLTSGAGDAEIISRRFETTRFGTIEVDLDLVIHLSEGIIGFESCRDYVVVRHDDKSAFRWFQSLQEPGVAFPVVEPFSFRPDYAPTISDTDARMLGLKADTPTLLFVVVSVPGNDPRAMTANLLAPIVINAPTRQGKQVIVQDEGYSTRHNLVTEMKRGSTLSSTTVAVTQITAAGASPIVNSVKAA